MSKSDKGSLHPSSAAYRQLAHGYAVVADAAKERGDHEGCVVFIEMALICAEEAMVSPQRALPIDPRARIAEVTEADYIIYQRFVDEVFNQSRRTTRL